MPLASDPASAKLLARLGNRLYISASHNQDGLRCYKLNSQHDWPKWEAHLGCGGLRAGNPLGGKQVFWEALADCLVPAAGGQQLFVDVPAEHAILALDAATGRQLSRYSAHGSHRLIPVQLGQRQILLAVGNLHVLAFDQRDLSRTLWEHTNPGAGLTAKTPPVLDSCAWDEDTDALYLCLPAAQRVERLQFSFRWGKLHSEARAIELGRTPANLMLLPAQQRVAVILGQQEQLVLLDAQTLEIVEELPWLPDPQEAYAVGGTLVGWSTARTDTAGQALTRFAAYQPGGQPRQYIWDGVWTLLKSQPGSPAKPPESVPPAFLAQPADACLPPVFISPGRPARLLDPATGAGRELGFTPPNSLPVEYHADTGTYYIALPDAYDICGTTASPPELLVLQLEE